MATGAPDWQGLAWKVETTNRPRQVWPSGRVVWTYDFETPWRGINVASGTISFDVVAGYGNSGGNSLKLESASVAGTTGTVYRHFGPVASGKYGLEVTYAVNTGMRNLRFGFQVVSNSILSDGYIDIMPASATIKYYDSDGNWTTLPGTWDFPLPDIYIWQRLKLTLDVTTGKYTRLLLDNQSVDMTSLALKTAAGGVIPRSRAEITIAPDTGTARTVYIDDVTVTEEE